MSAAWPDILNMTAPTILISGASIAGPVLAYWDKVQVRFLGGTACTFDNPKTLPDDSSLERPEKGGDPRGQWVGAEKPQSPVMRSSASGYRPPSI
jgi:hypothetical protein